MNRSAKILPYNNENINETQSDKYDMGLSMIPQSENKDNKNKKNEKKKKKKKRKRKKGAPITSTNSSNYNESKSLQLTSSSSSSSSSRTLTLDLIDSGLLTIGSVLGLGGFGEVLSGTFAGADVALKKLKKNLSSDAINELIKEANMMKTLNHPNLVRFYGMSELDNCLVMVIELMTGGELYDYIRNNSLSWNERYRISIDITNGLNYLHYKNIVHRDLKSLNILLNGSNQAKISDFGLSRARGESSSSDNEKESMTSSSGGDTNVGTIRWMAPECFDPSLKRGKHTDIYALGMVFWEIITQKIPYEDEKNNGIVCGFIINEQLEDIPDDCQEHYASIIRLCWKYKGEERPTAQEVLEELRKDYEDEHDDSYYEIIDNNKNNHNYNIDNLDNEDKELFYGIINNNINEIETAINNHANIDANNIISNDNNINYNIIHIAILNNCPINIMNKLVEYDIDLEIPTSNHNFPLHLAVIEENEELIKFLIRKGVNLNIKNMMGDTPLHLSLKQKQSKNVLKLLLKGGANPNELNKKNLSPLMICINKNDKKKLKTLCDYNANLNQQDNNGDTILHYAIKKDNYLIIKVLLHFKNIDLNIKNNENKTSYELCNNDMIKKLLENYNNNKEENENEDEEEKEEIKSDEKINNRNSIKKKKLKKKEKRNKNIIKTNNNIISKKKKKIEEIDNDNDYNYPYHFNFNNNNNNNNENENENENEINNIITGENYFGLLFERKLKIFDQKTYSESFILEFDQLYDIIKFYNNDTNILSYNKNNCIIKFWSLNNNECLHELIIDNISPYISISNNNLYFSISNIKKIQIYEFETYNLIQEKKGHRKKVNSISFLNNNDTEFISISDDKSIRYWDMNEKNPLNILPKSHEDEIIGLKISNNDDYIITYTESNKFKLWSILSFECIKIFCEDSNNIKDVIFDLYDNIISINEISNLVMIYDYDNFQYVNHLKPSNVTNTNISKNGKYIFTYNTEKELIIYKSYDLRNIDKKEKKFNKKINSSYLMSSISKIEEEKKKNNNEKEEEKKNNKNNDNDNDNDDDDDDKENSYSIKSIILGDKYIACCGFFENIHIFDISTLQFIKSISIFTNEEILEGITIDNDYHFSPFNNEVLFFSDNENHIIYHWRDDIRIFSIITSHLIHKIDSCYYTIELLSDNSLVLPTEYEYKILNLNNYSEKKIENMGAQMAYYSPNKKFVIGFIDYVPYIFDTQNLSFDDPLIELKGINEVTFTQINFSIDDNFFIVVYPNYVRLHSTTSYKLLNEFNDHSSGNITNALITNNMDYLITFGSNSQFVIYDFESYELINKFNFSESLNIKNMVITNNDEYILTGDEKGDMIIYNVDNLLELKEYEDIIDEYPYTIDLQNSISTIVFSEDYIACALKETFIIQIYPLETLQCEIIFDDHDDEIDTLLFYSNDQYLISSSTTTGKINIWSLESDELIHKIDDINFNSFSVSYDNQYLAIAKYYDVKILKLSNFTETNLNEEKYEDTVYDLSFGNCSPFLIGINNEKIIEWNYDNYSYKSEYNLNPEDSTIKGMNISENDEYLITYSSNDISFRKISSLNSILFKINLNNIDININRILFTKNNSYFIVASNNQLDIYDINNKNKIIKKEYNNSNEEDLDKYINDISINDKYLILGSADNKLYFYKLFELWKEKEIFYPYYFNCQFASQDKNILNDDYYIFNNSKDIYIFDLRTFENILTIKNESRINSLSNYKNDNEFLSLDKSGKIKRWSILSGECIHEFSIDKDGHGEIDCMDMDISPNYENVAIVVSNRIELWDLNTESLIYTFIQKIEEWGEEHDILEKVEYLNGDQIIGSSEEIEFIWNTNTFGLMYKVDRSYCHNFQLHKLNNNDDKLLCVRGNIEINIYKKKICDDDDVNKYEIIKEKDKSDEEKQFLNIFKEISYVQIIDINGEVQYILKVTQGLDKLLLYDMNGNEINEMKVCLGDEIKNINLSPNKKILCIRYGNYGNNCLFLDTSSFFENN